MSWLILRLIEFAIFCVIMSLFGAANGAAFAISPWLLILSIPASLLTAVAMWLTTLATIDRCRRRP
jgi:hypothetical protein